MPLEHVLFKGLHLLLCYMHGGCKVRSKTKAERVLQAVEQTSRKLNQTHLSEFLTKVRMAFKFETTPPPGISPAVCHAAT